MPEPDLLEIENLSAGYNELDILHDISFGISPGEISTIVGPNGAGKTTIMRTIIGLLDPSGGNITYQGNPITNMSVSNRIQNGLALVPERRHLFRTMTVKENLKISAQSKSKRRVEPRIEQIFELFPRLEERASQDAGTLSGGEAQMLSIGRSLVTEPQLLLLDEPSLGLAPMLVEEVFDTIVEINDQGVSILLVEQQVEKALETADSAHILSNGEIQQSGRADDLVSDDRVIEEYLGGE